MVRTIAGLLVVAWSLGGRAEPVTSKMAGQAVDGWIAQKAQLECPIDGTVTSVRLCTSTNGAAFYVAKLSGGGFVVTSTDTEIDPVVAFSSESELDEDPRNPLWALLSLDMADRQASVPVSSRGPRTAASAYATVASVQASSSPSAARWAQLLAPKGANPLRAGASPVAVTPPCAGASGVTLSDVRVSPLLKTKWNQSTDKSGANCYNYYTPKHYLCGCTATALAQILRYHKFPTDPVEPQEYGCQIDGKYTSRRQMGGVYEWDKMPYSPGSGTTTAQRKAIGKLTYDVSLAVNSSYTRYETFGFPDLFVELSEAWGYAHAEAQWVERGTGYSKADLMQMLIPNLDAKLPVCLSIYGPSGNLAHAIVADGYGFSGGQFGVHLNMGWAGASDAWYILPGTISTTAGKYKFVDEVVGNIYPRGPSEGAIVSGRVLSASTSKPLSGIVVTARDGEGTVHRTTTDAKGIYAFILTEGECVVSVENASPSSYPVHIWSSCRSNRRGLDFYAHVDGERYLDATEIVSAVASEDVLYEAVSLSTDARHPWTGNASWLRSASVGGGQNSTLSLDFGPRDEDGSWWFDPRYQIRTLTFQWRVSGGMDGDRLACLVNGVVQTEISGETGWSTVEVPLASDKTTHVEIIYQKNGSTNSGGDCGYLRGFGLKNVLVPEAALITVREALAGSLIPASRISTDPLHPWTGDDDTAYCEPIESGESSELVMNVPAAELGTERPGYEPFLAFKWRCANSQGGRLACFVDGKEVEALVGKSGSMRLRVPLKTFVKPVKGKNIVSCQASTIRIVYSQTAKSVHSWDYDAWISAGHLEWISSAELAAAQSACTQRFPVVHGKVGQPVINPETGRPYCQADLCLVASPDAVLGTAYSPDWSNLPLGLSLPSWGSTAGILQGSPTEAGVYTAICSVGWESGDEESVTHTQFVTQFVIDDESSDFTSPRVIFRGNGGQCDSDSRLVKAGATLGELPVATRDGHAFLGWYTNPSGGTKVTPQTQMGTSDMMVYAHWQELALGCCLENMILLEMGPNVRSYPLTLTTEWVGENCAFGSGGVAVCQATLPKGGLYTFAVDEGLAVEISVEGDSALVTGPSTQSGRQYFVVDTTQAESSLLRGLVRIRGDVGRRTSLVCVQGDYLTDILTKRMVKFNANGGSCLLESSFVKAGEPIGCLPKATRPGYAFCGWFTAPSGGEMVLDETAMADSDLTLYAHWRQPTSVKTPGSTAQSTKVTLVADALGGSAKCYSFKLMRGQVYTFSVPKTFLDGGGDLRVELQSEGEYDPMEDGARVGYGGNGKSYSCLVDLKDCPATVTCVVWLTRNGPAVTTTLGAVAKNTLPVGCRGNPIRLTDEPSASWTTSGDAQLLVGGCWFAVDVDDAGALGFAVSGLKDICVDVEGEIVEHTGGSASDCVVLSVQEARSVLLCVNAGGAVTGKFSWEASWGCRALMEVRESLGDNRLMAGGSAAWFVEGSDVRSGEIEDDELSWLETTVLGHGTLSFDWSVSSERGYDKLKLVVDGLLIREISGEQDWQRIEHLLEKPGRHVVRWIYSKDESSSDGSDCGWIRNLSWAPISHQVSFDANEGVGEMEPMTFSYDEPQSLRLNEFTNGDAEFFGWALSPKGAVAFSDGEVVKNLAAEEDVTLYAVWASVLVPGKAVSMDLDVDGGTVYSSSGIPTGLKLAAVKSGKTIIGYRLTGAATKPGVFVAKIGIKWEDGWKETWYCPFRVLPFPKLSVVRVGGSKSKVSGSGGYPMGKKVSPTATVANGDVLLGWYSDPDCVEPIVEGVGRKTKFTIVTGEEDRTIYAKFITKAEDLAAISLNVGGVMPEGTTLEATNALCGVAISWPITSAGYVSTSVSASGLPKGLKLVRGSGPGAYTLCGAPTKTGKYSPKFKVTTGGKNSRTYVGKMTIVALPEWARGQFTGYVDENVLTMTVGSTGKISGKFKNGITNWTFSVSSYAKDSVMVGDTNLVCRATANGTYKVQSGKKTVTKSVAAPISFTLVAAPDVSPIAAEGLGGFAGGTDNVEIRRVAGVRLSIDGVKGGTVKMDKSYGQVVSGKSVKLTAKLTKGYAFLGWFDAQTGARLSQATSYSLKMADADRVVVARFAKESALAVPVLDWNAATNLMVGVSYSATPKVSDEAAVKIAAVTGLPKGLVWKSGKVTGVATTAKTNTVSVKVVLATNAKKYWTLKQRLVVAALPAWAKGTYVGGWSAGEGTGMNQVTLTVGSTGKASGKLNFANASWTLTGTKYTKLDLEARTATLSLTAKRGTTKKTVEVTVGADELGGFAMSVTSGFAFESRQNLWKKDDAWAARAAELVGIEYVDPAGDLTVLFGESVAVAAKLKVGKNMFSCSAVFCPIGIDETAVTGKLYLYFKPDAKKKFKGALRVVDVSFPEG